MKLHDIQENIASLLMPRMNRFMPHKPFAKQIAFWMLPHREALFGGALGGGKSDILLTIALENIDIPGYAAMLFRRTLQDHKLPGAPLDRMNDWLAPFLRSREVKYSASGHAFTFPTWSKTGKRLNDSTLQFCYIGESTAYLRYQGSQVSYIGYDEVTQHTERDYTYMFTRLRTPMCPLHAKQDKQGNAIYDPVCELCQWVSKTPLRMRSTCNPDGPGFAWVKKRFGIKPNMNEYEAEEKGEKVRWIGTVKNRPFIPAFFTDNPFINHKEYGGMLKQTLSDELYQALVEGSWGITPHARFKRRWKKIYSMAGRHLWLGPNMQGKLVDIKTHIQYTFQTVDSAATLMQGIGDVDLFPGRVSTPSSSVISTWALTSCYNLIWLGMVQFREEIPEVVEELKRQYKLWKPNHVVVEANGVGRGVAQYAERAGMRIVPVNTEKDKLVNATDAIMAMSNGRIWFPQYSDWLEEAEDQVFTWQGHPSESDDIIDTLSNACNFVDWSNVAMEMDPGIGINTPESNVIFADAAPSAYFTQGTPRRTWH